MNDDYRQLNQEPTGIFADVSDIHVSECISRIESLKMKLMGEAGLDYFRKSEMIYEMDILRAAFLHLVAGSQASQPHAISPEMAALNVREREHLELEGILGQNPQILKNLQKIARIAPTGISILLEGETGAGKEIFARIIHLNSKKQKFVAVNCGAFPAGVIESELFGHVKGAYTGATSDRKGKFEEANGGTIFLDEIADLELQAQVKLLRVLDQGELQRVGSDKIWKTDVRVVAASNKSLEEMVRQGKFREDLYYRLSTCHLFIPPLRERRDEIELLFEYFVKKTAAEYNLPLPEISDELMRFLFFLYDYPGNIRELRNLSQYITVIFNGSPVEVADLPPRYEKAYERLSESGEGGISGENLALHRRLVKDSADQAYLVSTLKKHKGNVMAVCNELQLSRSRIYQLLKKFNIRPMDFQTGEEEEA